MPETQNQSPERIAKKKTPLLLLAFVVFWTPIIIFSKIAGEIIEREPIGFDRSILMWIHGQASSLWDNVFLIITTLGNAEIMAPVTLLIAGTFWYKKQRLDALIVAASVGGAAAANFILKQLFHRDRPTFWSSAIHETGYSFPSGHAMISSALFLSLIFIAWNTRARWWALVGGVVAILLIGTSRLYLGVHYPTDIIAGWCVSFVWVSVVFVVAHGYTRRILKRG